MSRRPFACFVALAIGVTVLAGVPTTAGAAATDGLSAWKSCGKRVQCAILQVPVVYAWHDVVCAGSGPGGDEVAVVHGAEEAA